MDRRVKWLVLFVVAAGMVAYFGFGLIRSVVAQQAYSAEYDQTRSAIREMEGRPPFGFDPGHWQAAVIWSHNAYVETFMFHDAADLDALRRFGAGLRERLSGPPGPAVLEWIWDALEQASPRGKRYVDKFRADFREQLDMARPAAQ
jgi:hypothetical protein